MKSKCCLMTLIVFVLPILFGACASTSTKKISLTAEEIEAVEREIQPVAGVEAEPDETVREVGSAGVDWARFLGPTADGKSPETGILTEWGPCGPPVVWHCELGSGYGIGPRL